MNLNPGLETRYKIRTKYGVYISQSHYVDKILEKLNKDDSGVVRTPLDNSPHLSKNRGEGISQVEYSSNRKSNVPNELY